MIYEIKRGNGPSAIVVASVHAQGVQDVAVMAKDRVEMTFRLPSAVQFRRGDTVTVFGQTYKINRAYTVKRTHDKLGIEYNIEFEALYYDLAKWQLKGLDAANDLTVSEVFLTGTAATVVDLIVRNANRVNSGWEIGVVDDTEAQQFTFVNQSLLTVLTELANTFDSEYWVDGKVIHFQKREASTGITVEFGKGKGLYNLTRGRTDTSIINRLYVEGGSRNLPSGYGASRLQLPIANRPYLQATIAPGEEIVEHSIFFDNIFPSRTGTVTALGVDEFAFVDNTLDFNINDQLAGTPAKVSFVSGQLASFEFEIEEYVQATKTITIKPITDDAAYPDGVPNDILKASVGDKYVLLDINMPASYVTDAETKLLNAGQSYLDENKDDRHEYQVDLTPIWVLQQEPNLRLGYTMNVKDTELSIDKDLRIAGWQRDLQEPAKYTGLQLTERISPSEIVRQYAQQERILYAIQTAGLLDPETMRKNLFLNRLSERDGYLYLGPDKAKAGYADLAGRAYNADVADYALDSDRWDGFQFADYMNQPVRSGDSPRFSGTGSALFVSGFAGSGWNIVSENGNIHATFDKLTVRKEMNVYELVINQIRATNGSVWISDAIKINNVTQVGSNYFCEIDSDNGVIAVPFVINDIIRCQRWTGRNVKYYVARVVSTSSFSFTLTKLEGGGFPEAGDDVVRMGNSTNASRRGAIYLTASDDQAPYIDVIDGVTSASLEGKTKVRLGKLDGIVDPDMGALAGYGLYGQNVYLKGRIEVTGGNAATQTYAQSQASAAQAAAIAAAASDATTKANNARSQAVSTAATDATTKANAARDAAIATAQTYANNIAQSKADIAQAAAISAASADATSKANAAQSAAEAAALSFVNSLEVGAVNLLDDSGRLINTGSYGMADYPLAVTPVVGQKYTITLWGQLAATKTSFRPYNSGGNIALGTLSEVSSGVYQATITWSNGSPAITPTFLRIYQFASGQSGVSRIDRIKMEAGTKGTEWSPSANDVQAAIDSADAKAQAAQTAYNNLTTQLKGMAYKDIVQLADMGTTVISGGKLVTTLIDANYIRSNIINAGYINTLELNASIIKSGTIDSARINASQIISNGSGATQTYAQQQASAAQAAAIAAAATDATTKSNNARTSAISTAATDATTKANNAQAAAIAAASADAIAKANNALALARSFTEDKVSLVKNPAVTGDITGWSGSGLSVVNQSFNGLSTPVLRCTTSGDVQVMSDWFDVDPAKIYEVTLWMLAPTAGGSKYFGLHATSTANGTANDIAVEPITNGGVLAADTTNFYFWNNTTTLGSWRKMTAYILPSGFNPTDAAGIGFNISNHARMQPTTKRIRLRWLNYYNAGTSRQVFVAHPTVTEVSAQTLAFSQVLNTKAVAAQNAADAADSKAVAAQASATTANNALADISSDSKLTAGEKKNVKLLWDAIAEERPTIVAQATAYSVSSTAYTNSYNTLNSYLTPLLSNLNVTSNITAATFRTNFANYYDEKTKLLKAIADKAKALADAAQSSANTADTKAVAAQNAHNALTASLRGMAYKDVVALADLNSTIISGGKIQTTLLDVAWIRANIISAGLIQANEINVSSLFAQSITATNFNLAAGKIGPLNVSASALWIGNKDTWTANTSVLHLYQNFSLWRQNGQFTNQVREMAYNLYNDNFGDGQFNTLVIKNTIQNAGGLPGYPNRNIALQLHASNSTENIALYVSDGQVTFGPNKMGLPGSGWAGIPPARLQEVVVDIETGLIYRRDS